MKNDKFHYVYAGHNTDYNFLRRSTEYIIQNIEIAAAHGATNIVFSNAAETLSDITFKVQRIAEFFTDSTLTFTLLTGAIDGKERYEEMYVKNSWKHKIDIKYCNLFEQGAANQLYSLPRSEYYVKEKDKLFLSFNRVARPHRINLLEQFITHDLLKNSFFSFEGIHLDGGLLNFCENISQETISHIKKIIPLKLNITNQRSNPTDCRVEDVPYFDNSYLSIITETIFYKGIFSNHSYKFFSEKIYKPITFKHPFILLAWPGTLQELRNVGYKTFHPYIDETYDSVDDDRERFEMVIKELLRLSSMTTNEWLLWQQNIKDVVEFNYEKLLSKRL